MSMIAQVNARKFAEDVQRLGQAVCLGEFRNQVYLKTRPQTSQYVIGFSDPSYYAVEVSFLGTMHREFHAGITFDDLEQVGRFVQQFSTEDGHLRIIEEGTRLIFALPDSGAVVSIPFERNPGPIFEHDLDDREALMTVQFRPNMQILNEWASLLAKAEEKIVKTVRVHVLTTETDPIVMFSAVSTLGIYHPNRSLEEALSFATRRNQVKKTLDFLRDPIYAFLRGASGILDKLNAPCLLVRSLDDEKVVRLLASGITVTVEMQPGPLYPVARLRDLPPLKEVTSVLVERENLIQALRFSYIDEATTTELLLQKGLMTLRSDSEHWQSQTHAVVDGEDELNANMLISPQFFCLFLEEMSRSSILQMYVSTEAGLLIVHDENANTTVIARESKWD